MRYGKLDARYGELEVRYGELEAGYGELDASGGCLWLFWKPIILVDRKLP